VFVDGDVVVARRLRVRGDSMVRLPKVEHDLFALRLCLRIGRHVTDELFCAKPNVDLEIRRDHDLFLSARVREAVDERLLEPVDLERPVADRFLLERVEPRFEPRFVCRVPLCRAPRLSPVACPAPAAAWSSPCVASPTCWPACPPDCPAC
jgi:hypothetical protein